LKILSLLETAINHLQNKCNNSGHFSKTLLHHGVKHKSLKMLQLLYQALMTDLSTPPFFIFLKTEKHTFTAMSSSAKIDRRQETHQEMR